MTYHCGIGAGLEHLGVTPREPHITCDGCQCKELATTRDGLAKAWLRNGKAPKGWRLERTEEPFTRKDWCPTCRQSGKG